MPQKAYKSVKSKRHLYFIFLTVSILLAGGFVHYLRISLMPFQLTQVFRKISPDNYHVKYYDFDKDGADEYTTWKYNTYSMTYEIQPYESNWGTIDEFNVSEYTKPDWSLFADYNGDDFDDLFVFSTGNDSLFLSVIDIQHKKFLKEREYLLKAPPKYPHKKWDISVYPANQLFIHDGKKELLFVVQAGFALKPRSVYLYDLNSEKIKFEFKTLATLQQPFIFDLNNDGKNEIIASSGTSGNVHFKAEYDDWFCRLFILDQNLNLKFPQQIFSSHPGGISVQPVQLDKKPYLITYSYNKTEKNINSKLTLIDSNGKKNRPVYVGKTRGQIYVDQLKNGANIYLQTSKNGLLKFDSNLDKIKENYPFLRTSHFVNENILGDGKKEILVSAGTEVFVLDDQLELIARKKIDGNKIINISVKHTGIKSPKQIAVQTEKNLVEFKVAKNWLYSSLFWLLIGLTFLNYGVLIFIHRVLSRLFIYRNLIQISITKSSNGIMIVDGNGRVFYVNGRFQTLLELEKQIMKKHYFSDALQELPELREQIGEILGKNYVQSGDITVRRKNRTIKLHSTITPLLSFFNWPTAYIVELKDITAPILSDRGKVWSKTVQKIAHDIKTPLSTIQLNLKTLKMHLEQSGLINNEAVNDDINMMHTELERVRNMTKSFLKFTNLEHPNFQAVELKDLIEIALNQFRDYVGENLKIEHEIDKNLKHVWLDPQQIEMVLHILIENSIDALKGKGFIKISVNLVQYLDKEFQDFVEFEIADTGNGIDDEIKDKIFEPYFTTKEDGIGMGLALAKKIVEDHKGEIGFYTRDRFGTVVRFSIPVNIEI